MVCNCHTLAFSLDPSDATVIVWQDRPRVDASKRISALRAGDAVQYRGMRFAVRSVAIYR
jgi:hypothetical protein